MTIKKHKYGAWHYLLIVDGVELWLTIGELLDRYKASGLTKKQLYDRLNRLSKGEISAFKTVYDCVTTPVGSILMRRKMPRKTIEIDGSINLWPAGSLAHKIR